MIMAQALYDAQIEYAQIDGKDLHALLERLTGDPSPAGSTLIPEEMLMAEMRTTNDPDMSQFIQDVLTAA